MWYEYRGVFLFTLGIQQWKRQMKNNIVDPCFDSVSNIFKAKKIAFQTLVMLIFKLSSKDKLYCSTLESAHRLDFELEIFSKKLAKNKHFLWEFYQKGIHNVQQSLFPEKFCNLLKSIHKFHNNRNIFVDDFFPKSHFTAVFSSWQLSDSM